MGTEERSRPPIPRRAVNWTPSPLSPSLCQPAVVTKAMRLAEYHLRAGAGTPGPPVASPARTGSPRLSAHLHVAEEGDSPSEPCFTREPISGPISMLPRLACDDQYLMTE